MMEIGLNHYLVLSTILFSIGLVGVMRRKNLMDWLLATASKEITYAYHLQSNMRTGYGKILADKNSKFTMDFFENIFDDLRNKGIADFEIVREKFYSEKLNRELLISISSLKRCTKCGEKIIMKSDINKGIKCEKLNLDFSCMKCTYKREVSFCLPEIE